jgi:ATP:ADP antiporter, AAA family
VEQLSPLGLMLLATLSLAATLFLARFEHSSVPGSSRAHPAEEAGEPRRVPAPPSRTGGIMLVLRDHYLLLIALFVVVLNCINSTGEFILADFVKIQAQSAVATGVASDESTWIAEFYGGFQFWVTLTSLAIQILLVGRVYRTLGMRGALLVHPVIVLVGYGLLAFGPLIGGFIPLFSLIRRIKVADNGIDYSLTNTSRQTLFLPVDRDAKFDGKLAIDTFFVRFGDMLQAACVFVGLNLLGWNMHSFALLNVVLALVWIALAVAVGRMHARRARQNLTNRPPVAVEAIPDLLCQAGQPFRHVVPPNAFDDPDPGDVVVLTARQQDGRPLPRWIRFEQWEQAFVGTWPRDEAVRELHIAVTASDTDGLKARSTFIARCPG